MLLLLSASLLLETLCVCACVRAWVRACVRACARVCVCVNLFLVSSLLLFFPPSVFFPLFSVCLWYTAPADLSELLHLHSPSRSLRSASDTRIFRVPRTGRRTLGQRSGLSVHRTCVLGLSSSLCQAFLITLFF